MYTGIEFNGYQNDNLPTVMFIPGTLIAPAVYEKVVVPNGFQAIYVDWMSGRVCRNIDFVAEQVAQFIKDKKFPALIIAGYSSGGVIAMLSYLNLIDKSLVNGMLLSNTGCSIAGQTNSSLPDTIKNSWTDESIEAFIKRCFCKPLEETMYVKLFSYARRWPSNIVIEPVLSLRNVDLTERLKNISCPVYIAHGELDPVRKVFHAEMLRDLIPDATLWLLDAGHSPMYEASEEYSCILSKLAKQVVASQ